MSTPPPDGAALARERLAAKARRAAKLRRRVAAGALATFALAWGVVAFHGPMGAEATTTTTASTATAATSTSTSTSTDNSTSSSDNPVTTAQS